jgi:hypothetical protein
MKTIIYVENGLTQLVLTPETDFEKKVIGEFDYKNSKVELFKGNFAECQGGYIRQFTSQDSIMIKCDYKKEN